MRGFLQPSLKNTQTDAQRAFVVLSRHRRASLAESAQTTLVKASQWARGEAVAPLVAEALEKLVAGHVAKKK